MNKYHSRKVITSDGIVFDSRRESVRWTQLKLLERAGKITNLKRQVKYVLVPAQYESVSMKDYIKSGGKKTKGKLIERECSYIADFVYWDNETNEIVVEDTKGVRTKDYVIKRKLMLKEYGIRIKEV